MLIRIFFLLCWLIQPFAKAADEGQVAPEFRATLEGGGTFVLDQKDHAVTLIHFWATWCEACQTEMPALEELYLRHKKEGLQIIAISVDESKNENKAREQMRKYSFPWAFSKNTFYKKYGRIWRLPLTFVIDRSGTLRKDGWVNPKSLTTQDLTAVIKPLL